VASAARLLRADIDARSASRSSNPGGPRVTPPTAIACVAKMLGSDSTPLRERQSQASASIVLCRTR
jgi:hypothetical protein